MEIDRNQISFSQAEGLKSLPSQLRLGELSPELRNELWSIIYDDFRKDIFYESDLNYHVRGNWREITEKIFVEIQGNPLDQYKDNAKYWISIIKGTFFIQPYSEIFDLITFLIRCRNFKDEITKRLQQALLKHKAAYRIYEHHIIAISNEIGGEKIIELFNSNLLDDYHGAKAHLLRAGQHLSSGNFQKVFVRAFIPLSRCVEKFLMRKHLRMHLIKLKKDTKFIRLWKQDLSKYTHIRAMKKVFVMP